jgi:hypothetical protein
MAETCSFLLGARGMKMVLKALLWIVGVPVALALAYVTFLIGYYIYWSLTQPVFEWHQKMTVVIATPAGEMAGSSVSAIKWAKGENAWGMGWGHHPQGEAVVVDLGAGRYLFGLLHSADTYEYLGSVAPASISAQKGRVLDEALFAEVAEKRGRAAGVITVPHYQYPLLVTFTDIKDPKSVKQVDPTNLAASFGPGYALKSITLEITDEKVTEGEVEKVLGWIRTHKGRIKPIGEPIPKNYKPLAEEELYSNSFVQGN